MTKKTVTILEALLALVMLAMLTLVITGDLGWHNWTLPVDTFFVVVLVSLWTAWIEDKKKSLKEGENHV